MAFSNRTRRTLARLDAVPAPLRSRVRSFVIGRTIRFVGTAGLSIDEIGDRRVVVSVPNRASVQNHIGTVHAAAMALLAETATGLAVGLNVHDGAVPVLKSMQIDYVRRASGGLTAVAELPDADAQRLRTELRGEVVVPVAVTDANGETPIQCAMTWAWTPRRS